MAFFRFFLGDKKMSSFCADVLKNPLFYLFCRFSLWHNADWIKENYDTSASEDVLIKLITKNSQKGFRKILLAVVDHINADSITDTVFNALVNISNNEIRETVIVSLCHKSLSESQLLYLCKEGTQFECFFELAILYYTKEQYSISLLQSILFKMQKSPFGYMYADLLQELSSDYSASNLAKNILVAEYLISSTGDGSAS